MNQDGSYDGDKDVNDNCDYDSDGEGSRDRNWAIDWQSRHVEGAEWYGCTCGHSQALNCNQIAYAVWWLGARLAGWGGATAPTTATPTPTGTSAATATVWHAHGHSDSHLNPDTRGHPHASADTDRLVPAPNGTLCWATRPSPMRAQRGPTGMPSTWRWW